MKKLTVLLATALLAALFGATNAYAEEVKKISVIVDGDQLVFKTDPFIESGTTLVPFRTIFTKLGLTIGWDPSTKTVTGIREGLSIELKIGNKTAIVNGVKKSLTVAPKIVNSETFIPLRFVSENAQKEVSWDGVIREVYIADTNSQIQHVFEKYYEYMKAENIAGVLSTMDPSSTAYASAKLQLNQKFADYDIDYEHSMEIVEVTEQVASVLTVATSTKVSGPEFINNELEAMNELIKVNGQWQISKTTHLFIDLLNSDLMVSGKVAISQAEQDAILAVIEQSRVNGETEDWDAELLLYDSEFPDLELAMDQSKQLSAVYNFSFDNSNQEFLSAYDNTAVLYYETSVRKVSGPEFRDINTGNIVTFKKIDGKWLFTNNELLFIDYNV